MQVSQAIARGAVLGTTIAVVLVTADQLQLFSIPVNKLVEKAVVVLCPLYDVRSVANPSSQVASLFVAVAGNAVLYAALFGIIFVAGRFLSKFTSAT